jgi:hypothetical protein
MDLITDTACTMCGAERWTVLEDAWAECQICGNTEPLDTFEVARRRHPHPAPVKFPGPSPRAAGRQ